MTGTTIKGQVQREDLALFDGKTLVATRPNSSGGTQTGNRMGDAVDVKLIHGGSANAAAFQAALDSMGSVNGALLFTPETWTIAANVTVPANVTMIVPAGCVFSINSGITVTNNGILIRYHKTYTSGSGAFTQNGIDSLQTSDQTDIFGTDTGSTNTFAITTTASLSALTTGITVRFEASSANTGACTLNVDSLGAKALKRSGTQSAMVAGSIASGGIYTCVFDVGSDCWQVQNQPATAFAETILDDADAATVRATIGTPASAVASTISVVYTFTGSSDPNIVLKNTTAEDSDGGRESSLIWKGVQSGSEVTTLAKMQGSHDGSSDDQKGKLVISTNDGSDSDTPTAAVTIDSSQNVAFNKSGGATLSGVSAITGLASINSNPLGVYNYLINGDFAVAQRGANISASANNDDSYTLDQWLLLSDTNDVVDVNQITSGVPTNSLYACELDVETLNRKFAIVQILEQKHCVGLIGKTVTLSFDAKATSALDDVRCAILAWDGTADAVTSDIVNSWEAEGTNPTVVTNWTYENTPADLNVTTSYARYTLTADVDTSSAKNVAIMIFSNVTGTTAGTDKLTIANVQLEPGSTASNFMQETFHQNLARCQRYYEINRATYLGLSTSGYAHGGRSGFNVSKRVDPTIGALTFVNRYSGFSSSTTASSNYPSKESTGYYMLASSTTAAGSNYTVEYSAIAEL